MVVLLTGAEMAELDRAASEGFGLAGVVLMEHAGGSRGHHVYSHCRNHPRTAMVPSAVPK